MSDRVWASVGGGKLHRDERSPAIASTDLDRAAMRFDDGSRDGQPEPGPLAGPRGIGPREPLEHALPVLGGDAGSSIGDA